MKKTNKAIKYMAKYLIKVSRTFQILNKIFKSFRNCIEYVEQQSNKNARKQEHFSNYDRKCKQSYLSAKL